MNALRNDIQDVQIKSETGYSKDLCEYHVKSIKEDWKDIKTLNEEILAHGNYDDNEVQRTKKMVDEVIAKLYQIQEAQGVQNSTHVALPVLKIPVFEGSYET